MKRGVRSQPDMQWISRPPFPIRSIIILPIILSIQDSVVFFLFLESVQFLSVHNVTFLVQSIVQELMTELSLYSPCCR